MSLLKQVRASLERLGAPTSGLVVAVSGGADSVALLRALIELRGREDEGHLVVAHLNHGLRGNESDADEEFVRRLIDELSAAGVCGLAFRSTRRNIAEMAQAQGRNLEAVARSERYGWLAEVAATNGLNRVATGHTADDQAETVLHRLLRGAGLQGLRGIAARRELRPGIDVIRPMLFVTRAEVLAFLHEIGQPFREDRSNADLRYTRNRIRHELLPLLAGQYNPDIRTTLAQLAEQSAAAFEEIETAARAALRDCELPRAGEAVILDRARLATLPRNLLREVWRQLSQREAWPRDRLHFEDWDRLAGVALGELPAVDLPGRIQVRARERVVQVRQMSVRSDEGPCGSANT